MRVAVVLYLVLLGLVALVVGPASAVLLLPRLTVSYPSTPVNVSSRVRNVLK